MGLAEEAARAAVERKQGEAAAAPAHSRADAMALSRTHTVMVKEAFKEAAEVLRQRQVPDAIGVATKRTMWGNPVPRFGGRFWVVTGFFLDASGQVLETRYPYLWRGASNAHQQNPGWKRSFIRWPEDTRFVDLSDSTRVDFDKAATASADCTYIPSHGKQAWHVCPAGSGRIILGRPEGPLLGATSGGSLDDSTLIAVDLLKSIHHSVIQLVKTGGEYG